MRGSSGGKVMAIRQREAALRDYYANPRFCLKCGVVIQVRDEQRVSEVRKCKFCSKSCAAKWNNRGVRRVPRAVPKFRRCVKCDKEFQLTGNAKFCGRECRRAAWSAEIRGWTPETARVSRYKQLALEESVAQKLRTEGWEIFSPTVVCDRIGIKDGKVFFLEFKLEGKEKLRSGQQRIFECAPEMYEVVVHGKV